MFEATSMFEVETWKQTDALTQLVFIRHLLYARRCDQS